MNESRHDIPLEPDEYIMALDLGTYTFRLCYALVSPNDNTIEILFYRECPAQGLSSSGIVNNQLFQETLSCLVNSKDASSLRLNQRRVKNPNDPRVFVSMPGKFITYKNNMGSCSLNGRPVDEHHIQSVNDNARSFKLDNYELMSSTSDYYQVDSNTHVENPIGMLGGQLKGSAHLVFADQCIYNNLVNTIQSIVNSCYKTEFIFCGNAASEALTTAVMRNMGVCVLDIGHSAVDMTIFHDGAIVYSGSNDYAGEQINRELAVDTSIPLHTVDELKRSNKILDPSLADSEQIITMTIAGEHYEVEEVTLAEIMEHSYFRLFAGALKKLSSDMDATTAQSCRLDAGFVLTGGGANMPGVARCFAKFLAQDNERYKKGDHTFDLEAEIANQLKRIKIGKFSDRCKLTGMTGDITENDCSTLIGLLMYSRLVEADTKAQANNSFTQKMYQRIMDFFNTEM